MSNFHITGKLDVDGQASAQGFTASVGGGLFILTR